MTGVCQIDPNTVMFMAGLLIGSCEAPSLTVLASKLREEG